jgi:hypothetical protein
VVDTALNMAYRRICQHLLLSRTARGALRDQLTPEISVPTYSSWADAATAEAAAMEVMVQAVEELERMELF